MSLESLTNKRKRLIFRSEHRGTKEMDLLLGSFARRHIESFCEHELELYDAILQENDPNLYNWITGKEEVPANINNAVFERLKRHTLI